MSPLSIGMTVRFRRNPHKAFQLRHEPPDDRAHQRRRRQRLAAMLAEKSHHTQFALQLRHIHIETHPVDSFDRKLHMLAKNIGNALCYHRPAPVARFCL
jgi:hypothetical protein